MRFLLATLALFPDAKGDGLDGLEMLPDDRIKYLESQTQALEMQLAYRSEMTSNAIAECESMREELATATQKFEDEKQTTMDVTRTMTRQYKGMQEDLLNKINERERMIASLRDELEMQKALHAEQLAEKDRVIEQKNADALEHREEMENTFKHFANLLVDARLKICHHTKGTES
jgi:chromosome segregation ATPase